MNEVLLKVAIAAMGGALLRMLVVFGVNPLLAMSGLILIGAVFTHKLVGSRVFVSLAASFAYFITAQLTQSATATYKGNNPSIFVLFLAAAQFFFAFTLPALGSILAMVYEKSQAKEKATEEKELTVDELLAEPLPKVQPAEMAYDLDHLEAHDKAH